MKKRLNIFERISYKHIEKTTYGNEHYLLCARAIWFALLIYRTLIPFLTAFRICYCTLLSSFLFIISFSRFLHSRLLSFWFFNSSYLIFLIRTRKLRKKLFITVRQLFHVLIIDHWDGRFSLVADSILKDHIIATGLVWNCLICPTPIWPRYPYCIMPLSNLRCLTSP